MLTVESSTFIVPALAQASPQRRAIAATLVYYDLFDFPLNRSEVLRFAHASAEQARVDAADLVLESEWWSSSDGFWFLRGREELVARRAQLAAASKRKLRLAQRWAARLQLIPGVRFVGVSGSLSMASAREEDDIDLLIITAAGRLWLTRALVLGLLWAARAKRPDDGQADHPDQICANIFMSEDDLAVPDRNLFIAHEICQMLPLFGAEAYSRFIQSNAWVCDFLPQWAPSALGRSEGRARRAVQRLAEAALSGRAGARLEQQVAKRQLARIREKHARGHNVGVKLSPTQLRFHPRDLSQQILSRFNARWEALLRADGGGPDV